MPDENQDLESKIISMDNLLKRAKGLLENTDRIYEKHGISRKEVSDIAAKSGISALGARIRKEQSRKNPSGRRKKKKRKITRVKI